MKNIKIIGLLLISIFIFGCFAEQAEYHDVSVTVRNSEGDLASGITVKVGDKEKETDANGKAVIKGLKNGEYEVAASTISSNGFESAMGNVLTSMESEKIELNLESKKIENSMLDFIYNSDGSSDISATWDNWGSGAATEDVSDGEYDNVVKVTSGGGWGVNAFATAFMGFEAGYFSNYELFVFKIKSSDYEKVIVSIPSVEITKNITDGMDLGNGWYQMIFPISEFGDSPSTSEQLAILNNLDVAGEALITDIGLY